MQDSIRGVAFINPRGKLSMLMSVGMIMMLMAMVMVVVETGMFEVRNSPH